MKNKSISLLLAILLIISVLPINIFSIDGYGATIEIVDSSKPIYKATTSDGVDDNYANMYSVHYKLFGNKIGNLSTAVIAVDSTVFDIARLLTNGYAKISTTDYTDGLQKEFTGNTYIKPRSVTELNVDEEEVVIDGWTNAGSTVLLKNNIYYIKIDIQTATTSQWIDYTNSSYTAVNPSITTIYLALKSGASVKSDSIRLVTVEEAGSLGASAAISFKTQSLDNYYYNKYTSADGTTIPDDNMVISGTVNGVTITGKPATTKTPLATPTNVAFGGDLTPQATRNIKWNAVDNAASYTVKVYVGDATTPQTSQTIKTDSTGFNNSIDFDLMSGMDILNDTDLLGKTLSFTVTANPANDSTLYTSSLESAKLDTWTWTQVKFTANKSTSELTATLSSTTPPIVVYTVDDVIEDDVVLTASSDNGGGSYSGNGNAYIVSVIKDVQNKNTNQFQIKFANFIPTVKTNFRIEATATNRKDATPLTVTVYTIPKATLAENATLGLSFKGTDADSVTKTGTINTTFNNGGNPATDLFKASDFTIRTAEASTVVLDDITCTSIDTTSTPATLSVTAKKSVASGTYVIYYNGASIGSFEYTRSIGYEKTAKPVFASSTYQMSDATLTNALFDISNYTEASYNGNTVYKLYTFDGTTYTPVETGDGKAVLAVITGVGSGEKKLSIFYNTLITDYLPVSTTYYVTATNENHAESDKSEPITVNPFVAPSVTLGTDTMAEVSFAYKDTTEDLTDTINATFTKGTDTTYTFNKADFSLKTTGETPVVVDYASVSDIDTTAGTVTITVNYPSNDTTTENTCDLYFGSVKVGTITVKANVDKQGTTAAPTFVSTDVQMESADQTEVEFVFKNYDSGYDYKVYTTDATPKELVRYVNSGTIPAEQYFTLSYNQEHCIVIHFPTAPTADVSFDVTATNSNAAEAESEKTTVTAKHFIPASASVNASFATVSTEFFTLDTNDASKTGTIKLDLVPGTSYTFKATDFTVSSNEDTFTQYTGLSVTELSSEGVLTVKVSKSTASGDAYIFFGGKSIGKITVSNIIKVSPPTEKPTIDNPFDNLTSIDDKEIEYIVKISETNKYSATTEFKLYSESDNRIDELKTTHTVTDNKNNTLTVKFTLPTAPGKTTEYLMSAKNEGSYESNADVSISTDEKYTRVTATYTAPSIKIYDKNNTLDASFKYTDADTEEAVTGDFTLGLVINKGTETNFTIDPSKLKVKTTNTIAAEAITDIVYNTYTDSTNIAEFKIKKSAASTSTEVHYYLWYGDVSVGEFTYTKTVAAQGQTDIPQFTDVVYLLSSINDKVAKFQLKDYNIDNIEFNFYTFDDPDYKSIESTDVVASTEMTETANYLVLTFVNVPDDVREIYVTATYDDGENFGDLLESKKVKLTVKPYVKSTECEIKTFSFGSNIDIGKAVINHEAGTIAITVKYGTNASKLTPVITISEKATITPAVTEEDFTATTPVTYKVTSESGAEKTYTVTVTVQSKVKDVTFNPETDSYTDNTEFTLSCETEGATIYYIIDSGETVTYKTYTGPFTVTGQGDHTIDAYATYPDYLNGDTKSLSFNIDYPDLAAKPMVTIPGEITVLVGVEPAPIIKVTAVVNEEHETAITPDKNTFEGTLTYKWYKTNSSGDSSEELDYGEKKEYTLPETIYTVKGTYYYYCIVTNTIDNGNKDFAKSGIIKVTVTDDPLASAKATLEAMTWTLDENANDLTDKAEVMDLLQILADEAINNDDITATLEWGSVAFEAPVNGTEKDENGEGTPGEAKFIFKLTYDDKDSTTINRTMSTKELSVHLNARVFGGTLNQDKITNAILNITAKYEEEKFVVNSIVANDDDAIRLHILKVLSDMGYSYNENPTSDVTIASIGNISVTPASDKEVPKDGEYSFAITLIIEGNPESYTRTVTFDNTKIIFVAGIPATSVEVVPAYTNLLKPGDTVKLTANVLPADATETTVTWSVVEPYDPNVAILLNDGTVMALNTGKITVRATVTNTSGLNTPQVYGDAVIAVDTTLITQATELSKWYAALYSQIFTVEASASEGGSINPSGRNKVQYGGNLTFTVTPDDGYAIYDVTVDGKSVGAASEYKLKNVVKNTEVKASFYKLPEILIEAETVVEPEAEWVNPFIDVADDSEYIEAVKYVYNKGLIIGMSENEFGTETVLTRAMFVTILGRHANVAVVDYAETSFEDVPADQWYSPYVAWAASQGIVKGYDEKTFGLNDEITNEQALTILYRYAALEGYDVNAVLDDLAAYIDADAVASWALDAVKWAVGAGIYNGFDDMLLPADPQKRIITASLIYNFATLAEQ